MANEQYLTPNIANTLPISLVGTQALQFANELPQDSAKRAFAMEYQVPYAVRYGLPLQSFATQNSVGITDPVGNGTGDAPGTPGVPGQPGEAGATGFTGPIGPTGYTGPGGAGSTPGGSNKDIQFNNSSTLGGDDNFTWEESGQFVAPFAFIVYDILTTRQMIRWIGAVTTRGNITPDGVTLALPLIPSHSTMFVEVKAVAHSSDATQTSYRGGFVSRAAFNNETGTATLIGSVNTDFNESNNASLGLDFSVGFGGSDGIGVKFIGVDPAVRVRFSFEISYMVVSSV